MFGFVGVEFALEAVAGDGSIPGVVNCVPAPVVLADAVPDPRALVVWCNVFISSFISRSICVRTQECAFRAWMNASIICLDIV